MSLGVIGGMGPKATAVFFDRLIDKTAANRDQDHINIIILNHATLPDRTRVILEDREQLFLDAIANDIKFMEMSGVANIAIPCNTSHYFLEQMKKMTDVNIINMVDETMKEILLRYGAGSKVGILATTGTVKSKIYQKAGEKYDLQLYTPEEGLQERIMKIIYTIKSDNVTAVSELDELINSLIFESNCSCVILACTELSCVKISDAVAKYCIDAMEVLIKKSIILSGKKIKE